MEKYLIAHCAPTLASLKTGSLFCLAVSGQEELARQLTEWYAQLWEKGIFLTALRFCGGRALVYVCRRSHLRADLKRPGVARFLAAYGYADASPEHALARLRQRIQEEAGFPHEIGIFLGYPLGDVIGFIRNGGKNCKCSGCWKVYGNVCEAQRRFAQFQKCREIYARLWHEGRTVRQLTVAA